MIRHLSINNLLLIDKIELDFGLGLCVLTGETGAGKSMILESLELISGRRAKPNIRPENDKKTIITALINISEFDEIKVLLNNVDINVEEEIIIKRVIESDGKSKAMINDQLVSLSTLKNIAPSIIEIHSQFSEQGLLDNSTHIATLDDFGNYGNELKDLSRIWTKYKEIEKEYRDEKIKYEEIKEKVEDYTHDIKELNLFEPKKGEFEKLDQTKRILKNSRKINENINKVLHNFQSEDPPGIEDLFSKNISILDQIKNLLDSETLIEIEKLKSISIEISEISKFFQDFVNQEFDHGSLEKIDDRVSEYKRLAQKHSTEPDKLDIKLAELEKNLNSSDESKSHLEQLYKETQLCKIKYTEKSDEVSELRKKSAKDLDKRINIELPDLKLENSEFETSINESEYNELGKDKVIFKIRTNPKSKMGEIKDISSGGELCRIALAIKVTAEKENSSTMVFDEVDSGIGGAVSSAVGERLKRLGEKRQVLVVTHSPQVASQGQNHFLVRKKVLEENTIIEVLKIEGETKVHEIARMLSGKEITSEAILAAKKLMENNLRTQN